MQNKQRKRTPEDTIIGVKPVEEALLAGKFKDRGVQVPLHRDYYEVILPALEELGVRFEETHRICS